MMDSSVSREEVEVLISAGMTYGQISDQLQRHYQGQRGYSVKSVKRFCKRHNLTTRIPKRVLQDEISAAIEEVGPTYGRKMLTGYLRQKHNRVFSETNVGKLLPLINPRNHQRRRNGTACLMNPVPYRADYFGHKLHIDQNEKLAMYGVTHVAATDGHSRFIVSHTIMPIKNNLTIYDEIYRRACADNGLFHQIRVDMGKEFYLTLGMQEQFQEYRNRLDIAPYRQTESKKNLPIERFWVEVNTRVNYPLKACLVLLDNNNMVDMENEAHKYCVSMVSMCVAKYGTDICIRSWNEHQIPGRGKPSVMRQATNVLLPLHPDNLPDVQSAKALYEQVYDGRLTDETLFGIDPLADFQDLQEERNRNFDQNFSIASIFSEVVNERPGMFHDAVLYFIDSTRRFYESTM